MHGLISLAGSLKGDISDPKIRKWLNQFIDEQTVVFAADGGLNHLYKAKIPPHHYMGDCDSVLDKALQFGKHHHMNTTYFSTHKDVTDGELIMQMAIEQGINDWLILGSFSNERPDHVQATYTVISRFQREYNISVMMTDLYSVLYFLNAPCTIKLTDFLFPQTQKEYYVSLIPISDQLDGVTYSNLYYPLLNGTIKKGETIGVSNEGKMGIIDIKSGQGMLFLVPKDDE